MITMVRYECKKCGHEWDYTGSKDSPRCSSCSSRKVIRVGSDGESESADASGGDAGESESDEGGYTPSFLVEDDESGITADEPALDDSGSFESGGSEGVEVATSESPEMPELDPGDIEMLVDTSFTVLANQRGEHWELEENEVEKLSEAWTPVANKYAPYMMAEHMVEVTAILTTVTVVVPRLQEDAEDESESESESEEAEFVDEGAGESVEPQADVSEDYDYNLG